MSLISPPIPATIIPVRAIGAFETQLTIEENCTDDLEITQHPVQQGASITDHAYLKPSTVRVRIMFNEEDGPLNETYADFLELQASRILFNVVTGKRNYKNMLIKSINVVNDMQTENVLSISVELQQINIVTVQLVSVPPRANQKSPGKTDKTQPAGQKKATSVNKSTTNTSTLRSISSRF